MRVLRWCRLHQVQAAFQDTEILDLLRSTLSHAAEVYAESVTTTSPDELVTLVIQHFADPGRVQRARAAMRALPSQGPWHVPSLIAKHRELQQMADLDKVDVQYNFISCLDPALRPAAAAPYDGVPAVSLEVFRLFLYSTWYYKVSK